MKTRYLWLLFAGTVMVSRGASTPAASSGNETQIQFLSGHGADDTVLWNFYCNDGRKAGAWTTIHVPSCWEQEGFGTYNYGLEIRPSRSHPTPPIASEVGKYYYDFTVPADWKNKTVRIVFEGSMTDTEVVINGQSAGPTHQGAFYEFKYDITKLLKFGASNRLEVTVSKESANASINNAERRADYWNFGGIFRPVYLEALPQQFIDWTAINAKADGSFLAQIHLGQSVTADTKVTAQILDLQGKAVGASFSASVSAGADTATLHATEQDMKLWTAETPNLYRVRFTLASGHTVEEKFGFRTFEVRRNDGLYLNGQRIVLKGVNRHSFWPETARTLDRQICYDDVKLLKEANMNAVRMSHYPPDHEFLEACDELGIYVLDELGGWHGAYDVPSGQKLIGEMVRRDVNHPSILFWDNGNEGGWNAANDGEFAKWDPQARTVLHPWRPAADGSLNDVHYPTYETVEEMSAGSEVFMFTEFLHGLYDGGAATGLHDYWAVLNQAPHFGGGFIWAFLDEAVARTDEDGKLDGRANLAPDGIVGPHREKEGSFYGIREIWSPVQASEFSIHGDTASALVENSFDFINLKQCTFTWESARFPTPADGQAGHKVLASGDLPGPDVAPRGSAVLTLPAKWNVPGVEVLYLTAKDPSGHAVWTWSLPLPALGKAASADVVASSKTLLREEEQQWVVTAGPLELRFSKDTGMLAGVARDGKPISLANGPHFVAYLHQRGTAPAVGGGTSPLVYQDLAQPVALTGLTTRMDGDNAVIEAKYTATSPLKSVTWRISPAGAVRLDYTYTYTGAVDLLGVNFDYPEAQAKAITWEGWGPYRVYQNRMVGGSFDVWHNTYSDNIPGVTWNYPEFKGYFRGWRWAVLDTGEGKISVRNLSPQESFLGIFSPRDADPGAGPLLDLPKTGLAFFDVIPPNRDKGKWPEQLGPQSQLRNVGGDKTHSVEFEFGAN